MPAQGSAFFFEHVLSFSQDLGVSAHHHGTYFLGQGSELHMSSGEGSGVAGNSSFVIPHLLRRLETHCATDLTSQQWRRERRTPFIENTISDFRKIFSVIHDLFIEKHCELTC